MPILHLSLLQTTLQYFFFYIGLGKTSGVKASIIEALNVFVALFVACLLFKQEKLKQNKIIGSILGFAGVFLVEIWGSRGTGSSLGDIGIGEICVFISTVAYAFSSVYLRKYSEQEEPFVLSGYQFIVGGITLILLGFLMCIFLPASLGSGYAAMTTGQVLGAVASHMAGGFFSLKGCGIVLYLAMGIGGGIFALGCPLKVQPGIKSGGIWLYHADLWRALIRDFIAGGGHLAHRRFGDLFDPGIHRNTYGAEKLFLRHFYLFIHIRF